ncbi:MAG TPA: DUF6191 domain-containing protein [Propionibacteriaceae bacterium]|nr:DUF6191 domain-containing protein [Propionibacteriaceae bacterium]
MSFFEIFNPGLRHLREEKERQRMLVSKPTHGGGAPLGIDLDGGIAKFTVSSSKLPGQDADESSEPPSDFPDEADGAEDEART